MLFLLHLRDDVVQGHALVDFVWVEEVVASESVSVGVDDETLGGSSRELSAVWAEANVFDAHSQLDVSLQEILCGFGTWQLVVLLVIRRGPDVLIKVRVELIELVLHHASLFHVLRVQLR